MCLGSIGNLFITNEHGIPLHFRVNLFHHENMVETTAVSNTSMFHRPDLRTIMIVNLWRLSRRRSITSQGGIISP